MTLIIEGEIRKSSLHFVPQSPGVQDKKIRLLKAPLSFTSFRPFRAGNINDLIPALRTGLSHFVLTGQVAFISLAPTVLNETAQCAALGKKPKLNQP